ncbi:tRNA pseudouridine(38-40) synthase TruA [bacterium]|nr:MAG: tRNA pseudouridine(38-40) synthase TruA [bacterium]
MSRYKLIIEYEGTRYSGWQAQKEARTVQGEIITAVEKVLNTNEFELYASGRTDGGVHALRQVAHLEAVTKLEPFKLRIQINDALPADIHILDIEKADTKFHARHDAVARSYLYQISRRRSAFGKRFVWWIKDELNIQKMQDAAKLFVGLKNFQSFAPDEMESKSSKVMIESIQIKESGALILIRIVGSHFLWKMVRQMVGVMAEVGRGKLTSKDIQQFLQSKSDIPARFTAPPSGLFLERVYYKDDKRLDVLEPVLKIE